MKRYNQKTRIARRTNIQRFVFFLENPIGLYKILKQAWKRCLHTGNVRQTAKQCDWYNPARLSEKFAWNQRRTYIASGFSGPLVSEGAPVFCMYLATSETKARAKTVSTPLTSSFLQQKFPGLMKRELSVRCALKAWSTEKGKREKSPPPHFSPSLSLFSINLFAFLVLPDSDQWSGRGPPRVFFARTGPLLAGRLGTILAFLVYRFLPIWILAGPRRAWK